MPVHQSMHDQLLSRPKLNQKMMLKDGRTLGGSCSTTSLMELVPDEVEGYATNAAPFA